MSDYPISFHDKSRRLFLKQIWQLQALYLSPIPINNRVYTMLTNVPMLSCFSTYTYFTFHYTHSKRDFCCSQVFNNSKELEINTKNLKEIKIILKITIVLFALIIGVPPWFIFSVWWAIIWTFNVALAVILTYYYHRPNSNFKRVIGILWLMIKKIKPKVI